MKVSLRKRKLKSGKTSLYLDIYVNGRREYEYLNTHLTDAKSPKERKENKENLEFAQSVAAKRLVEIKNGLYGFKNDSTGEKDFLAFFKSLGDARNDTSESNKATWSQTYNHLKKYGKNNVRFADVNDSFVEGFKNYLLTEKLTKSENPLARNSAYAYFNRLRTALNKAYELNFIANNPNRTVKGIKQEEGKREYLTIEEVKLLSNTPCRYDVLKRAFLFGSLTGLRWSDINKLLWSEIQPSEQNGWSIVFRQKKTMGQEYLPMSEQAMSLLGKRGAPDDRVFVGLKYSAYMNVELSKWVMKAGITKNITFHCSRHTAATLLLTNGTDLYTVSKILGHRDIRTTQLYGKIVDGLKIKGVNSIPQIL